MTVGNIRYGKVTLEARQLTVRRTSSIKLGLGSHHLGALRSGLVVDPVLHGMGGDERGNPQNGGDNGHGEVHLELTRMSTSARV